MQGCRLTGLKVAHSCPALSHLFFADDTLIFCRANKEGAGEVMQILKQYGEASGQIVNMEKSSVFFGKNTDEGRKQEILGILGGMKLVKQSRYLGLPMVIGRSKRQVFSYIKEKVVSRLGR